MKNSKAYLHFQLSMLQPSAPDNLHDFLELCGFQGDSYYEHILFSSRSVSCGINVQYFV